PPLTYANSGGQDGLVAAFTSDGQHRWSKTFGSSSDDGVNALSVNAAGDVYAAGYFSETVSFGANVHSSTGSQDIFLAKLSASGAWLGAKGFGGIGFDFGTDLGIDSDGDITMVGAFSATVDFGGEEVTSAGQSDGFLVKYLW
ncbi:MAG: hypothetical protein JRH20_15205, partial [Deltaproteobacteria bacterium]|nr:hypothetical protein [Deltaproteobacteria bacterium]